MTLINSAAPACAMVAATSKPMEAVMRKLTARAVARPADHGIALEWSMALWILALAFLLATLQVY